MSLKVNYEVYVYLNKIGRKYTAATINVYLCLTYMNTFTWCWVLYLIYNLIVFVPLIVLLVKMASAPPHTLLPVITKPLPYTSG